MNMCYERIQLRIFIKLTDATKHTQKHCALYKYVITPKKLWLEFLPFHNVDFFNKSQD